MERRGACMRNAGAPSSMRVAGAGGTPTPREASPALPLPLNNLGEGRSAALQGVCASGASV